MPKKKIVIFYFHQRVLNQDFVLYNKEEKKKQTPESDNTITNRMNRLFRESKDTGDRAFDGSKNMEKPKLTPLYTGLKARKVSIYFLFD
jgi:hypothetical protein